MQNCTSSVESGMYLCATQSALRSLAKSCEVLNINYSLPCDALILEEGTGVSFDAIHNAQTDAGFRFHLLDSPATAIGDLL
jgi:hypothetical protein